MIIALALLNIQLTYAQIEFVIIVPSYNNERFYFRNLDSIVNQKVDVPFEVIYINDCSTDRTGELVDKFVKEFKLGSLVKVIHNKERVGALENLYNAIHDCPDHKIIVTIDGDDFLAHDRVLERVKKEYLNSNVWLTYGQFMYYPEGIVGCEALPKNIIESLGFRTYKFVTSHLRTFKAGLFKKIKKDDLLYGGKFYQMAWDLAFMHPMLEMASKGHIAFIPDILYIYNHHNPLSDHNVNKKLQLDLTWHISSKEKYQPLEESI